MRTAVSQQMMAAAAVRALDASLDDIAKVEVDGVEVDDLAQAQSTLTKREYAGGNWLTDKLDALAVKVANRLDRKKNPWLTEDIKKQLRAMKPLGGARNTAVELKGKLKDSAVGKRFAAGRARFDQTKAGKALNTLVLKGDPEHVRYSGTARVTLKSGEVREVPVEVIDVRRSLAMQRAALGSNLLSIAVGILPIPVIDRVVPALTGASILLGSAIANAAGNPQYAKALQQSAKKQFLLIAAPAPMKLQAAAVDANDIRGLRNPKE